MNFLLQIIVCQNWRQLQFFFCQKQPLLILMGNSNEPFLNNQCQIKRLCACLLSLKLLTLDTFRAILHDKQIRQTTRSRLLMISLFKNFVLNYTTNLRDSLTQNKQKEIYICSQCGLTKTKCAISQLIGQMETKFTTFEQDIRNQTQHYSSICQRLYDFIEAKINATFGNFEVQMGCGKSDHTGEKVKYQLYKPDMRLSLQLLKNSWQHAFEVLKVQEKLSQKEIEIVLRFISFFQNNQGQYYKKNWNPQQHLVTNISIRQYEANFSFLDKIE